MSTSKFRVCVKLFKSEGRQSYFDGPWRKSPEAAIDAFKGKLVKHSLQDRNLYQPMLIEQVAGRIDADMRKDVDVVAELKHRGLLVPGLLDLCQEP